MSPYKDIPASAIVTFTGRVIEPLSPDPAQIDIIDIAHALSNQCRFTGHTKEYYSVAQHSVLVSQHCAPKDALWGLLHDASEAYLADIARPVKRFTEWGDGYLTIEALLMLAVAQAFNLPDPGGDQILPPSVKYADDLLLRTEMLDLMPEGLCDLEAYNGPKLKRGITCWTPPRAKEEFLSRFLEITNAGYKKFSDLNHKGELK